MPVKRDGKWYWNPDELSKRLGEAGSFAELARQTGVHVNTIKGAADTLGIVVGKDPVTVTPPPEPEHPDVVLTRENANLRRQVKRLSERDAAEESVIRRIEAAIENAQPTFQPVQFDVARSGDRTAQELVLLFSDTHASEVVSLEETEGLNEYGWEIMLARMAEMTRAVVSHVQHYQFRVSRLHLFLLGDMLSGDIHEELAITNDRPAAEAVVDFAYDTAAWITDLVRLLVEADAVVAQDGEYFVNVAGVPGNHPRASKKPQAKLAHNNGDWLSYKMLEAILRHDPAFRFDFKRGGMNIQLIAERYRALLMHGDGIRSTMPGVPWGGVTRRVATLEAQMMKSRTPLDFVFMGHWHSPQSLAGIQSRTWINSSVKGPDEYSLKMFGQGHDASQTLLSFHPKRGWTGQYPLDLTPRQAASEGWSK